MRILAIVLMAGLAQATTHEAALSAIDKHNQAKEAWANARQVEAVVPAVGVTYVMSGKMEYAVAGKVRLGAKFLVLKRDGHYFMAFNVGGIDTEELPILKMRLKVSKDG